MRDYPGIPSGHRRRRRRRGSARSPRAAPAARATAADGRRRTAARAPPAPRPPRSSCSCSGSPRSQFAGYYAAKDTGLLGQGGPGRDHRRGRRRHRAADPAGHRRGRLRDRVGAQGAGVARAGRRRSPTSARSTSGPARCRSRGRTRAWPRPRPRGQEGRQLGLRQRVRAVRRPDRRPGVDPKSGVTLVQQQFDMAALLSKQIDAAQAMIYNEYAQVLEQKNPATGRCTSRPTSTSSTGTRTASPCSRTPSGPTPTS